MSTVTRTDIVTEARRWLGGLDVGFEDDGATTRAAAVPTTPPPMMTTFLPA